MTIVNDLIGGDSASRESVRVQNPGGMRWLQVESGFWVANVDGNFGGTIERVGERFRARDAMSVDVGEFSDADSAKRAVAEQR